MANTFELIASITVGSGGAASMDFTSIPQTYTDLVVKLSGRATSAGVFADTRITLNSTAGNSKMLEGSGSAAASYPVSWLYAPQDGDTATASTFGNAELYIPNYTGSSNKSVSIDSVLENNATTAYAVLGAGLVTLTAAVTSIQIYTTSQTWKQYSTAYLYGVKNA
jgi:hypothetical protein